MLEIKNMYSSAVDQVYGLGLLAIPDRDGGSPHSSGSVGRGKNKRFHFMNSHHVVNRAGNKPLKRWWRYCGLCSTLSFLLLYQFISIYMQRKMSYVIMQLFLTKWVKCSRYFNLDNHFQKCTLQQILWLCFLCKILIEEMKNWSAIACFLVNFIFTKIHK